MGLADLFKKGLEKTRSFFAGSFTKLAASSGHFDEDMLDELEELLIRQIAAFRRATTSWTE